jgi:DNA polymerase-3 subunit epsilon
MELSKPIVFFDLETTGLSTANDRIVELYMLKKNVDGTEEEFYSKFNPFPIAVGKEAEELHGLSNEMLKDEPKFHERAHEIIEFIKGCDIGGYNIISFDLPFLTEELLRSGITYSFARPHMNGHRIFDSYKIWVQSEPRNLTGAVKRFLNEKLEDAHRAKNDVIATARIFEKQVEEFGMQYEDLSDLSEKTSELKNKLDLSGKFRINDRNQIIISFGKHKDKTVQEIFASDPDYFLWISDKSDMSTEVKTFSKQIHEKLTTIKLNA